MAEYMVHSRTSVAVYWILLVYHASALRIKKSEEYCWEFRVNRIENWIKIHKLIKEDLITQLKSNQWGRIIKINEGKLELTPWIIK